jgi:hypothetical protein
VVVVSLVEAVVEAVAVVGSLVLYGNYAYEYNN